MAPQCVASNRKNEKSVRSDAEAICEPAGRPSMRFVPIKDEEQQAVLTVYRAHSLLVSERPALVSHIRRLISEFGVVLAQGGATVRTGLAEILEDGENGLPARAIFAELYARLRIRRADRAAGTSQ